MMSQSDHNSKKYYMDCQRFNSASDDLRPSTPAGWGTYDLVALSAEAPLHHPEAMPERRPKDFGRGNPDT